MQQRQLRLGDILDDYCTRERRVTNHAIVAMVGRDVKQTRCTTCDTEHEYKHAKVPRQRRKSEGQPPPTRPAPEFTIRQPNSRQGRFRPRHQQHGASPFHGNRPGNTGGGMRQGGGNRPPMMSRGGKRHGPKRSK